MPAFVPTYIQPTIIIGGQTQTFQYGVTQALSQTQFTNLYPPTSMTPSQNCLEFINANNDGFRFRHNTTTANPQGTLIIEGFFADSIPGSIFMTLGGTAGVSMFNLETTFINGISSAPMLVAGTGAGTSPTLNITGNQMSGVIMVTPGSSPAANAVIVTVSLPNSLNTTNNGVIISPANAAAANLATSPYAAMATLSTFTLTASSTALVASTLYQWAYQVIG